MSSRNIFGDLQFIIAIESNAFDYKSIKWYDKLLSHCGNIIFRFDLAHGVDAPSQEILHDIARIVAEVNSSKYLQGIYFYAKKANELTNLYAFNNQISFIKEFTSGRYEARVLVTRIEYKNEFYFLMVKYVDSDNYANLKVVLENDEEKWEDAIRRKIKYNEEKKLKITEVGVFSYKNQPFLFGRWTVYGKILLVDLKCTYLSELTRILESGKRERKYLFREDNFNNAIVAFKSPRETFLYEREESKEEADLFLWESLCVKSEQIVRHCFRMIKSVQEKRNDRFEDETAAISITAFT